MRTQHPIPILISPVGGSGVTHTLDYWVGMPDFNYHYHREFELVLTRGSAGRRLIGDDISAYGSNDIVLLGPNLPHTWIGDMSVDCEFAKDNVVVHFTRESLGFDFLARRELLGINNLLDQSARGLSFCGPQAQMAVDLMGRLPKLEGCSRLIIVVDVLNTLADCQAAEPILSEDYQLSGHERDYQLYACVLDYINKYSDGHISLTEISAQLNMSIPSFCRFFRRVSGTSFVDFLLDWRVSHACALLLGSDQTTVEISAAVGFANLSNFNRQFLRRRGMSPRQFAKNASKE